MQKSGTAGKTSQKAFANHCCLSFFARNPTAAGAGMLSGTRTEVFIPWKRIRKTKYFKKQKYIMLYGGFAENVAVFCTEENYNKVKLIITENMRGEQL